jgi:hypothetical protein
VASESLFSGLNRLRKNAGTPSFRGPPLTGRPGMTLEFFSALLRFSILPKAQ